LLYRDLLFEHDITHLLLNIGLGEFSDHLLTGFGAYLVSVDAFEVDISRSHMVHRETCKLNVAFGNKCDRVESLLIHDVRKLSARIIDMRETFPKFGSLTPTLQAE
jgi:hypothetical protein